MGQRQAETFGGAWRGGGCVGVQQRPGALAKLEGYGLRLRQGQGEGRWAE